MSFARGLMHYETHHVPMVTWRSIANRYSFRLPSNRTTVQWYCNIGFRNTLSSVRITSIYRPVVASCYFKQAMQWLWLIWLEALPPVTARTWWNNFIMNCRLDQRSRLMKGKKIQLRQVQSQSTRLQTYRECNMTCRHISRGFLVLRNARRVANTLDFGVEKKRQFIALNVSPCGYNLLQIFVQVAKDRFSGFRC